MPTPKHGLSASRFYSIYLGMKKRCLNKNSPNYKDYGGRGIKLEISFQEFREHYYAEYLKKCSEIGEKKVTIERINNDGNYCIGNLKWASHTEQANNRRSTHKLTFQKKTLSIKEWARTTGIARSVLSTRITREGWSIEKALTTPSLKGSPFFNAKDYIVTSPSGQRFHVTNLTKFCKENKLSRAAMGNILQGKANTTGGGWTVQRALKLKP